MNTLEDLRRALGAYADRGEPRGATAVLDAAARAAVPQPPAGDQRPGIGRRRRSPMPTLAAVAAAAFVLVAGVVAVVRSGVDDVEVHTAPTEEPGPDGGGPAVAPRSLTPLPVPGGSVQDVHVAFDRVWVATGSTPVPGEIRVRAFTIDDHDPVVDVALKGWQAEIAATDRVVYVRTRDVSGLADQPDGRPSSAEVVGIDPASGEVVSRDALADAGPMTALGSRLAYSDTTALRIRDDATGHAVEVPIREAIGRENRHIGPNGGATFGFTGLAFVPGGPLVGRYAGGPHLFVIDPATGTFVDVHQIDDAGEPVGPLMTAADARVWTARTASLYGVPVPLPLPSDTTGIVQRQLPGPIDDLAPVAPAGGDGSTGPDPRVVAVVRSEAIVTGAPDGEELRTTIDSDATSRVVHLDGIPWIVQWKAPGTNGDTLLSFVQVRTDASTLPGGATTATEPSTTAPPSTQVDGGEPTIVLMTSEPLSEGEEYPLMGTGLPPGPAVVSLCLDTDDADHANPCGHAVEPDPQPTVTIFPDGQLMTDWTATRSVYDNRWHDCAVERCVLRLYGLDPTGRFRDTSTVLAEVPVPLTFSAGEPPRRPSLALSTAGPIRVGDTVTIIGESFPAARVSIGICRAGRHDGTCWFDRRTMDLVADADGRFEAPFTMARGSVGMPDVDPIGSPLVDCTAAPGTCSFTIWPDEGSSEPYAVLPLTIAP